MVKKRVTVKGETYCSVPEAARMLGTNTAKIKKLMGDETLDWEQLRLNGPLRISKTSIASYLRRMIGDYDTKL